MLLADKTIGHLVPVRFAPFPLIGMLGLIVHLAVLWTSLHVLRLAFIIAQTVATIVAMASNFFVNNIFTYRDQRLRGWRLIGGLLSFYLICGIGAVANVGIATLCFRRAPILGAGGKRWYARWIGLELCRIGCHYMEALTRPQ
jgi:dolichol-phosphate mannosyltransferase